MLLGVIREIGELDLGASTVSVAPETAAQSSKGSVIEKDNDNEVGQQGGQAGNNNTKVMILHTAHISTTVLLCDVPDFRLTCLFKALQVFLPVPTDLSYQCLTVWGQTLNLLQPFL